MLDTKKSLQYLAGQGGNPYKMTIAADTLTHAGIIPTDDRQPLRKDQAVALLLACCAPIPADAAKFALETGLLHNEAGKPLHSVLAELLDDEHNPPAQIRVLHQKAHVVVELMTGDFIEFGECFQAGGFRSERIISGGLMSLLAMKLKDHS